jgi:Ca-activated chloride channel family protein
MSFAAPIFLLALLLVPLGIAATVAARRRRRRYAVRFPATGTVAAVMARTPRWRRRIPATLLALAVTALAVALARPQTTVAVPVEEATVVLITDTSRSMGAEDVDPSRMEAARGAARRFLDRVPDELRVGLVAFSSTPHTVERPTRDRGKLDDILGSLVADGSTATGDALDVALDTIGDRRKGSKRRPPAAIVLLSDGKTTEGKDPIGIARRAAAEKVPVYTVALGTPGGSVPGGPFGQRLPVPPDPETLREISRITGGEAFTVDDRDELDRIYEKVGSQVGTKSERREITAGFAGAGFVLLAGGVLAGLRWRARL